MNDVTWIRTHNNKGIYTSTGTIYNAGHAWLATSSGYNVGIGTISPSYKLHVVGDIYTTTGFKKNGSSNSYVLLGGGGHKAISDFSMSHSHPYLPLSGGTMTGVIASNVSSGSYINANKGNAIINSKAAAGFNMLARMKSINGVFIHGVYDDSYKFYYTSDATISAGTNTTTACLMSLG